MSSAIHPAKQVPSSWFHISSYLIIISHPIPRTWLQGLEDVLLAENGATQQSSNFQASNSAPTSLEINLQKVVPEIVGKRCIICTLAGLKQELRLMSSAYDSKLHSAKNPKDPNATPISIHFTPIHLRLVFDQLRVLLSRPMPKSLQPES